MLERSLQIPNQSFFLFGPRQTGKTTLLTDRLRQDNIFRINLLDPQQERQYSLQPETLAQQIAAMTIPPQWVIIDEVQKSPKLLDIVHHLIETQHLAFALTGSSARKLKHGGANLLAGRAFLRNLHPFTHKELGDQFELNQALQFGTLPPLLKHQ